MGLFSSKASNRTTNQTNNTSTQSAIGDGDNPLSVMGEGINIDMIPDNLAEQMFALANTSVSLANNISSSALGTSEELNERSMSLVERNQTNEQLSWLFDMSKITLPIIGVIAIAYFYFRK